MASNGTPSKRIQRAKSEVSHSRTSLSSIKQDFRSKFFTRLRMTRSKSVDRLRQIVENYGENIQYRSLNDLRKALSDDKEARELMQSDEVNDVLKQIEEELAQVHLQQQADSYENETEQIVTNLLLSGNPCCICNKNNDTQNGPICSTCAEYFNTEFQ